MTTPTHSDEERHINEILRILQEDYIKAAQPYIDRLMAIQPVRPMLVTLEQAYEMGLVVPNDSSGVEPRPKSGGLAEAVKMARGGDAPMPFKGYA